MRKFIAVIAAAPLAVIGAAAGHKPRTYFLASSAIPEQLPADHSARSITIRCKRGYMITDASYTGSGEIVTTNSVRITGRDHPQGWTVVSHLDPAATRGSISVDALCVS